MRGAAFASRLVLEVAPVSGNDSRAAHSWMGVIVIRKSPWNPYKYGRELFWVPVENPKAYSTRGVAVVTMS